MIDELREEVIVSKVGGRFRLSALIQKRMVALMQGSRPLVDLKTDDKIQIVIREILEEKIYLDSELNVRTVEGDGGRGGPPELDLAKL